MLNRTQAAELIGCQPSQVARWADAHGIASVWVSGQPHYRADHITAAVQARPIRLARFIRNALIA